MVQGSMQADLSTVRRLRPAGAPKRGDVVVHRGGRASVGVATPIPPEPALAMPRSPIDRGPGAGRPSAGPHPRIAPLLTAQQEHRFPLAATSDPRTLTW